jgi:hypothetical protein
VDVYVQRSVVEQCCEAAEIVFARHRHDVGAARRFSGCAVRRGDAGTVAERAVERSRRVGDEIEQRVDAVRMAVPNGVETSPSLSRLRDAELAQ